MCPIIVHFLEIDEKMEQPSRDNSNFLSPNYHIIITTISKFGQKNLQNDMKTYIFL
jgi:hypothetical protein